MKITFQGAAKIVTGSCYLFEVGSMKFLVDCGMFQGKKETVKRNYDEFRFDPKEIQFVLLTHAHIDHCGLIPKLVKEGFTGTVYTTEATRDLCNIMLEDSANVQREQIEHENKRRLREGLDPREPLYKREDVEKAMELFKTIETGNKFQIDKIEACFRRAGHILGSSMIEVFVEGKKLVFSGDLGQDSQLILEDAEIIKEADYLFLESTYGNRLHHKVDERLEKLAQVINDTHKKGGKLFIPVFAVERTQEIIISIEELLKKGMIPKQPVYLDSPLAIKATKVFRGHPEEYDDDSLTFNFEGLQFSPSRETSMKINTEGGPAIILAGSGMCNAGRIRHHIKHGIWNKNNTILFVGYQAEGTLGEKILSGEKEIKLMGLKAVVKADVERIDSFSGHADQRMLLNWFDGFENGPKKVFVIHGEKESSEALSEKIKEKGVETEIPEIGQTIEL